MEMNGGDLTVTQKDMAVKLSENLARTHTQHCIMMHSAGLDFNDVAMATQLGMQLFLTHTMGILIAVADGDPKEGYQQLCTVVNKSMELCADGVVAGATEKRKSLKEIMSYRGSQHVRGN